MPKSNRNPDKKKLKRQAQKERAMRKKITKKTTRQDGPGRGDKKNFR